MIIKNLYFKRFGPYQDWQFAPKDKGLHFVYGPNESGKTSLLEGMRSLLFGYRPKERKESAAFMNVVREGREYHIGRDGKKLNFYRLGEESLSQEPAELWWHGLDRKTYEKIFGLTLEDLQGVSIMNAVEVRTRFFGVEGGERLGDTVKDIEKVAGEFLVSSANGKRKINVLLEQLKQKEQELAQLAHREEEYVQLRQQLINTEKTEAEVQASLAQRKEYNKSVALVLHAWETYRRAEAAKSKMDTLMQGSMPDQEEFLALDKEISQCREHMRIWRGKEEALVPDHFSPDAPVGLYARDIESLYEQLARWEQLQKECEQGARYLTHAKEQLQFSRHMYTTWRDEGSMPKEVDWLTGERLARRLREAREAKRQWQQRAPQKDSLGFGVTATVELVPTKPASKWELSTPEPVPVAVPEVVTAPVPEFFGKPLSEYDEPRLEAITTAVEGLRDRYREYVRLEKELARAQEKQPKIQIYTGVAVVLGLLAIALFTLSHLVGFSTTGRYLGMALLLGLGIAAYGYGYTKQRTFTTDVTQGESTVREAHSALLQWAEETNLPEPTSEEAVHTLRETLDQLRKAYYNQNLEQVQNYAYSKQQRAWEAQGQQLETELLAAQAAWEKWRPEGSIVTCGPEQLFPMKQEYDGFMEQQTRLSEAEKKLKAHEEELQELVRQATQLWEKLGFSETPSPILLRQLYRQLQGHRQNQVRYEQKESQRRNYREEYDKWHCKEKDLLLQQDAILQRHGFASATAFRRQLISVEQYRQWETIYKQSKIQLKLLAPNQDTYDLLTRRLREGNKAKWEDEYRHGQEQEQDLEQKLAALYEQRGKLQETMRQLGGDRALANALQERKHLEEALRTSLEDWAAQVYMMHCIEQAQAQYEAEKQPKVIETASSYLAILTEDTYRLIPAEGNGAVTVVTKQGEAVPPSHWSSGLADQVYLALRLSLAKQFGRQVEPMPIILDDILLRFDEQRQRAALRLLADLAQDEQIFLFSCQAHLQDMAKAELGEEGVTLYEFTAKGLRPVS